MRGIGDVGEIRVILLGISTGHAGCSCYSILLQRGVRGVAPFLVQRLALLFLGA